MIAALVSGLVLAASLPTLTLGQALDAARAHNPDLKVMQARLDEAHESSRKVWSNYLPQISVGGSYTYNNVEASITLPVDYYVRDVYSPQGPPESPSGTPFSPTHPPGSPSDYILYPAQLVTAPIQVHNQFGAQAQLSQAIIAPALWPAISASYLGEKAAELNVDHARQQVLFAVAQLYYGAVAAKEAANVQQEQLATDRAHVKDAKVRVDAGAAPKVVLLRAELDEATSEQDLVRADDAYQSSKSALAALLDRAPDFDVTTPPDPPPPPSADELEAAGKKRADILAAEKSAEAAAKSKASAELGYLPSLGLKAAYQASNVTGFTGSNTSWYATLGLSWTLFDGGLREANLRTAGAEVAEAEASLESARVKAADELRRARLDYASAVANEAKAKEQERLAKENAQLINVGFAAGTSTQLEVTDATTQLRRAELGRIAQTLDAQLAVLELAKAAGTFDPK